MLLGWCCSRCSWSSTYSQMRRVGGDEDIFVSSILASVLSIAKKMHLEYVFNNIYPKFMWGSLMFVLFLKVLQELFLMWKFRKVHMWSLKESLLLEFYLTFGSCLHGDEADHCEFWLWYFKLQYDVVVHHISYDYWCLFSCCTLPWGGLPHGGWWNICSAPSMWYAINSYVVCH